MLLPGICMGVILSGEGGHTQGDGLLKVSPAGRKDPWGRAPPVLHHLLLQSRGMVQEWHCQLHSGAAVGQRVGAPPGLGACTSSSGGGDVWVQPDLGPGWGFWCMGWDVPVEGHCTALLCTHCTGEPTLPRPQVWITGVQVLGAPALLPAMIMLSRAQLCWCL